MTSPTDRTRPTPQKFVDVRVPMLRTLKKKLALLAIDEGIPLSKLALRFIVAGLDAKERPATKKD